MDVPNRANMVIGCAILPVRPSRIPYSPPFAKASCVGTRRAETAAVAAATEDEEEVWDFVELVPRCRGSKASESADDKRSVLRVATLTRGFVGLNAYAGRIATLAIKIETRLTLTMTNFWSSLSYDTIQFLPNRVTCSSEK